jgi:hypothetical protein
MYYYEEWCCFLWSKSWQKFGVMMGSYFQALDETSTLLYFVFVAAYHEDSASHR